MIGHRRPVSAALRIPGCPTMGRSRMNRRQTGTRLPRGSTAKCHAGRGYRFHRPPGESCRLGTPSAAQGRDPASGRPRRPERVSGPCSALRGARPRRGRSTPSGTWFPLPLAPAAYPSADSTSAASPRRHRGRSTPAAAPGAAAASSAGSAAARCGSACRRRSPPIDSPVPAGC